MSDIGSRERAILALLLSNDELLAQTRELTLDEAIKVSTKFASRRQAQLDEEEWGDHDRD